MRDEDVHCKDVLNTLAGARKNVTAAEQRCERRVEECRGKTDKWKRKHASLTDKLAVINAGNAVTETQARVGHLRQSIALALAVHHAVPNGEWKVAQRLAGLKTLDDEAKSDILSSCHKPTEEKDDELHFTARLNGLAKRLNTARVEHGHAEDRLEALSSSASSNGGGSGGGGGGGGGDGDGGGGGDGATNNGAAAGDAVVGGVIVVGKGEVGAAAGSARTAGQSGMGGEEHANVTTPTTKEQELATSATRPRLEEVTASPSWPAGAPVNCLIPTDSDAPSHETFATMLMGVSPSVIVEGMPGVLCAKVAQG